MEELSLDEIVRLVEIVLPGRVNVVLRIMGVDETAIKAGKRAARLPLRPRPGQLSSSANNSGCQGVARVQPKSSSPQPHQGSAKGGLIIPGPS